MRVQVLLSVLLACGSASAQGLLPKWFGADLQVTPSNVVLNGSPVFSTPAGMQSAGVSSMLVSAGAGRYTTGYQYEVRTSLRIAQQQGTYVIFLNATPDASLSNAATGVATGSFFAVRATASSSGGTCVMNADIVKFKAGVFSVLTSGSFGCWDNMAIRVVARANFMHVGLGYSDGGGAHRFPMLQGVLLAVDNDLGSMPGALAGIGVSSMPASNGISYVSMHNVDTTAPPTPALPAATAYPAEIQMQWPGAQDDAAGAGIHQYVLARRGLDGQMHDIQWLRDPNYIDKAVANEAAVGPGPYEYSITTVDFHFNSSAPRYFTVQKAPAGSMDPRLIGVRPTGSYWGGAGEQIDVESGNVNFTLPLVDGKTRTGVGVGISLRYNSQNWRKDATGIWNFGRDTGYGYGWRLAAGSVTPVYGTTWDVDHYVFTDSTGAEYKLNYCGPTLCESADGFISFERDTNKIRFNDGTWWLMNVESSAAEYDAGTLYPSLIQDTNGNQIQLHYRFGAAAGYPESSSRLASIIDSRQAWDAASLQPAWTFTYQQRETGQEYLSSISGKANYVFGYSGPFALTPPWSGASTYGNVMYLSTVTRTDYGMYRIYYNGSTGEVTSVQLPYGAQIAWTYRDFTYVGNRTLREVYSRYLKVPYSMPSDELSPPAAMENTHFFWRDDVGDSNRSQHYVVAIYDGTGQKVWYFNENRKAITYQERKTDGVSLKDVNYVWTTTGGTPVPYVQRVTTSIPNGDSSSVPVSIAEQTLDNYGNVITSKTIEPGSNRARTTTFEYLHNKPGKSAYAAAYLRNRLTAVTVTDSGDQGNTYTPFTAEYDGAAILNDPMPASPPDAPPSVPLHDSTTYTPTFTLRGNATNVCRSGACTTINNIDKFGMVRKSTGPSGTFDAIPTTSYWQYGAVAGSVKLNGVETSLTYDGFLRLTTTLGVEGANTFGWDSMDRPTSRTNPDGSSVQITYSSEPVAMKKEVSANRWTETYLDGLGRPARVITGYGGVTLPNNRPTTTRVVESIVDTRYSACACNPFGRASQVSRPRTSISQPLVWTTTTYDPLARPATITHAPVTGSSGSSGTTTYEYSLLPGTEPRQRTKITDAAGRWKMQSVDAFGDLREVNEPNPAGGADYVTSYTYNALGKLKQVSMPRPHPSTGATVTQTRTFTYYTDGTLKTEVLPETGTTRYVYSNGKLVKKFDNDNRSTKWEYDPTTQRLTTVRRLATVSATTPDYQDGVEDVSLRTSYTYDSSGRVSTITSGVGTLGTGASQTVIESFGYTAVGQLAWKQMGTGWGTLSASWTYDSIGRVLSETYPSGKKKWYVYGTDGRNNVVADDPEGQSAFSASTDTVTGLTIGWRTQSASATYDAFGRMSIMSGPTTWSEGNGVRSTWNQAWGFNDGGQITGYSLGEDLNLTYPTQTTITYDYGSSAATGKLASTTRSVTAGYPTSTLQQTSSYAYDSLGRLSAATTPATSSMAAWSQGFTYDGFGNLVMKTGTGEAAGATFDSRASMTYPATGGTPQNVAGVRTFDQEQRLVFQDASGGSNENYGYDSANRRIVLRKVGAAFQAEVTFWVGSRRMGRYQFVLDQNQQTPVCCLISPKDDYMVGGRMVRPSDRIGSNLSGGRRYLPYGEELSTTLNDADKFATYHRDMTGLDYADQRYYVPGRATFLTADPYRASAGASNPGSWNRYAYVEGDPVNRIDETGLDYTLPPGQTFNPSDPRNVTTGQTSVTVNDRQWYWDYSGILNWGPSDRDKEQDARESGGCYDVAAGMSCEEADRRRRERQQLERCSAEIDATAPELRQQIGATVGIVTDRNYTISLPAIVRGGFAGWRGATIGGATGPLGAVIGAVTGFVASTGSSVLMLPVLHTIAPTLVESFVQFNLMQQKAVTCYGNSGALLYP